MTRRRGLGPAIVVAAVVLGPGSILTSSKVGAGFGYELVWLLVGAVVLMAVTVALAGRLGASFDGSLGDELARRLGRPLAALVGLVAFIIVACFQVSNDAAVLAALETLTGTGGGPGLRIGILVALNAIAIATIASPRNRYPKLERLMKVLVLAMVVGFAGNLAFAAPDPVAVLGGLVPSWPAGADVLPTTALVATTFSVAGAFYQAYLVREKGWTVADHRRGLVDAIVGIGMLGAISLVIMMTAAATLHGRVDPAELRTVADVAAQLEPLFGRFAYVLFGVGIFAGAFSSFVVNAMIAGALGSDGLGLGSRMDERMPRMLTALALLIGLWFALSAELDGHGMVDVIFVAQAATVVGAPLLAIALLFLATRPDLTGDRHVPRWMKLGGGCAVLATIALSVRTVLRLGGA